MGTNKEETETKTKNIFLVTKERKKQKNKRGTVNKENEIETTDEHG
jgi:hypothetical protein